MIIHYPKAYTNNRSNQDYPFDFVCVRLWRCRSVIYQGRRRFEAPAVDVSTALEQMKELVALFQRGQTERLPIVLNAVVEAMKKDTPEKQIAEYRKKAKEKAEGNIYARQPADIYVAAAWEEEVFDGEEEALAQLIETYYHLIFQPWE